MVANIHQTEDLIEIHLEEPSVVERGEYLVTGAGLVIIKSDQKSFGWNLQSLTRYLEFYFLY